MKRYLPFLIIALVAAATAGSGVMTYRAKVAAIAESEAKATASAPGAKGAMPPRTRGQKMAAVTIEEFADFQCPPCASLSTIIQTLEQDYHGKVRVIFRHYPLPNHQHARPAAYAAEAAAMQGKFWEFHDLLYKTQSVWSKATEIRPLLTGYAATLGLDVNKFSADLDKPETSARINADQERAAALGVKQTPTLFVNNQVVPVASFNAEGLRAVIKAALEPRPSP